MLTTLSSKTFSNRFVWCFPHWDMRAKSFIAFLSFILNLFTPPPALVGWTHDNQLNVGGRYGAAETGPSVIRPPSLNQQRVPLETACCLWCVWRLCGTRATHEKGRNNSVTIQVHIKPLDREDSFQTTTDLDKLAANIPSLSRESYAAALHSLQLYGSGRKGRWQVLLCCLILLSSVFF